MQPPDNPLELQSAVHARPGRKPRVPRPTLSAAEFRQLVAVSGSRPGSRMSEGARYVLMFGFGETRAARLAGCTRSSVRESVGRLLLLHRTLITR